MRSQPMEAELGDFLWLTNEACKALWNKGEVIQMIRLNAFLSILKAEMRDIAIRKGTWTKGELSIRRNQRPTASGLDSKLECAFSCCKDYSCSCVDCPRCANEKREMGKVSFKERR